MSINLSKIVCSCIAHFKCSKSLLSQEYASSLLLNGYQTVDDLKHLKERHLIELNVTDPEHRHRLLAASDCLYVTSSEYQYKQFD